MGAQILGKTHGTATLHLQDGLSIDFAGNFSQRVHRLWIARISDQGHAGIVFGQMNRRQTAHRPGGTDDRNMGVGMALAGNQ